jgi:hypothetical protein
VPWSFLLDEAIIGADGFPEPWSFLLDEGAIETAGIQRPSRALIVG